MRLVAAEVKALEVRVQDGIHGNPVDPAEILFAFSQFMFHLSLALEFYV